MLSRRRSIWAANGLFMKVDSSLRCAPFRLVLERSEGMTNQHLSCDRLLEPLPGEMAAIVPVEQAYRTHSDNRQRLDGEICYQM